MGLCREKTLRDHVREEHGPKDMNADHEEDQECHGHEGKGSYPLVLEKVLSAALLCAFEGTDKAYSWERRERTGGTSSVSRCSNPASLSSATRSCISASSGVKARSSNRPVGFVREVSNDQTSPWFEHTDDFRHP